MALEKSEQRYTGKEGYVIIDPSALSIEAYNSGSFAFRTQAGDFIIKPHTLFDYPVDTRQPKPVVLSGHFIETVDSPDPENYRHFELGCYQTSKGPVNEAEYTLVSRATVDPERNFVRTEVVYRKGIPLCLNLEIRNGDHGIDASHSYWLSPRQDEMVFEPDAIFHSSSVSTSDLRTFIDSGLPLKIPLDEVRKMGQALLDLNTRAAVLPPGQRIAKYSPDK